MRFLVNGSVTAIRSTLPPGSYLVLSHANTQGVPTEQREAGQQVYQRDCTAGSRTTEEVARFFGGFARVDPGPVWVGRLGG